MTNGDHDGWGEHPHRITPDTVPPCSNPPPPSVTTKGRRQQVPPAAPVTLSQAVASGQRLTVLRTLAARLAADLDGTRSARDAPLLALRLMDVLEQIDALGGGVATAAKGTPLDEFTGRLAARKASADTA